MSRPSITFATGTNIKIQVPAGWFTTVSVVSRRTYNRLVTVDYVGGGSASIGNTWGRANEVMRDLVTTNDLLAIVPQPAAHTLDFSVYFSTTGTIRGDNLQEDKYRCNRANIITTNKPARAPADFPDYTTYLIFVEDSPSASQTAGNAEYDDSLITVNILKGVAQTAPPVADTVSQAFAESGKQALAEFINQYTDPTRPGPTIPIPDGPLPPVICPPIPPAAQGLPVCILGAGVSGLYIAMMLDSLGIRYEIMEGSGRIGGRLYTHNFPNIQGKYQYYDVGAMRYPDTSFMQRTFDLARNRLSLQGKMLPYIRSDVGDDPFLNFNGITKTKKESAQASAAGDDIFNFSLSKGGTVPDEYVRQGSGQFWNVYLGELRQLFVDYPFKEAFEKLKAFDGHTVTSYLIFEKNLPYEVIKWYETVESRTGLFDEALTETVLASLVFNDPRYANKHIDWFCFDGGSEIVHKAMTAKILTKPVLNRRAIAIRESDGGHSLTVTFDTSSAFQQIAAPIDKKYSNVISTMSMGCLRMVNTDDLLLTTGQRAAIRELNYTPSIKIGLQFRTAWWERLGIVGGQSSTDRPIRDIVYPSYGPDESHPNNQKSNCMIASYNGMQDSQRLGGLMKGRNTPEEKVMLDLVLRDLAAVHRLTVEQIRDELEDYYPWDFYRDQFQLGAFCQFGPGQFKNTYPYLTMPGSRFQRFHFAGDATSTFHGWVAGALNSGWRAVLNLLQNHPELNPNPSEDIIAKFKNIWGPSEEFDDKDLAMMGYLGREIARTA